MKKAIIVTIVTALLLVGAFFSSKMATQQVEHNEQQIELIKDSLHESIRLEKLHEATGFYHAQNFYQIYDSLLESGTHMTMICATFGGRKSSLKVINDKWGHQAGDMSLVAFSEALRQVYHEPDVIFGVRGGSTCYILYPRQVSPEALQLKASYFKGIWHDRLHSLADGRAVIPYPALYIIAARIPEGGTDKVKFEQAMQDCKEIFRQKGTYGFGFINDILGQNK